MELVFVCEIIKSYSSLLVDHLIVLHVIVFKNIFL